MRLLVPLLLIALSASAAETNKLGLPNPPKADVPYIIHATSLLETEVAEAVVQEDKKEMRYFVTGVESGTKTPLAAPEFLFRSESIDARLLQLHAFEKVNGRREILVKKKKKTVARPIVMDLFPVEDGLTRMRVDGSLPAGEYCLTPEGSDAVFCFSVF